MVFFLHFPLLTSLKLRVSTKPIKREAYASTIFLIIYQKWVRGFHQGFQTPRNRGVWKSQKLESGIGTGMGTGTGTGNGNGNGNGNGTGTVMWKGTNTRTGTSFALNYFNSNSIYTKKIRKLVWYHAPPRISLYCSNDKVEKAGSNSFTSASHFLSISSPPIHNYDVNDKILSSLENVNGGR